MTDWERGLLDILLARDFPGRDAIKRQLLDATVATIDKDGSLRFEIKNQIRAIVIYRVAAEAEYLKEPGKNIHFLLHVVDGIAHELEIFREDGGDVAPPPLSGIKLI